MRTEIKFLCINCISLVYVSSAKIPFINPVQVTSRFEITELL